MLGDAPLWLCQSQSTSHFSAHHCVTTTQETEMPSSARTAATVADLMRKWRRLLEINTTEAGERLGLSSRSIEDIEQGRTRAGDELTRLGLEGLIHDASHEAECREAALAALREKKSKNRKKTP